MARLGADLLILLHFAFILFAVLGGLLVLRRRRWAVLHLPCVVWAGWIEFQGGRCPLTPWEDQLRMKAQAAGQGPGIIENLLVPVIYPAGLTHSWQMILGCAVILFNLLVYWLVWRRLRADRRPQK